MAAGENFSTTAGNIGSGLGAFIGGLTNPIIGGNTQTSVSVTEKPNDKENDNTVMVITVVAVILIVGISLYFIFK